MDSSFDDLLILAKNHDTVDEFTNIIYKAMNLNTGDKITVKELEKITKAADKRKKKLCKKLEDANRLGEYYDPN